MINKVIILLALCSILVNGYNIYLVTPQSYGHAYPLVTLAKALSFAGHNTTFFTFPMTCDNISITVDPSVHYVNLNPNSFTQDDCDFLTYNLKNPSSSPISSMKRFMMMFGNLAKSVPLQFENYPKPDLIIYDIFAFGAGSFATKHSIPAAIVFPSIFERKWASYEHCMTSSLKIETYTDRVINTVKCSLEGVMFYSIFGYLHYILSSIDYPSPDWGSHLKLINSQFTIEKSVDISPLTKMVGPLISLDRQEKNEEIEKLLDSAKASGKKVMYVSLGTVWAISEENMKEFIDALSQLKDLVIVWPVKEAQRTKSLDNLPEHIKIFRHVPQLQVLSHPQVKLFLSHCGANSMIESIWFGVPILPIPIAADQYMNAQKLSELNLVSAVLNSKDLKSETIVSAVNKYFNDDYYRNNTKELSNYFRSTDNINQAVKEVETFIGLGGLRKFLVKKNPNFFVYYHIDILLTLIPVIIVAYYLLKLSWKITKKICCCCCNRNRVVKKKTE